MAVLTSMTSSLGCLVAMVVCVKLMRQAHHACGAANFIYSMGKLFKKY